MTNGPEVSLIVTLSLFPFIVLICSILLVIRFSHPEDDTGLMPKIITIICFTYAFTIILAVPASTAVFHSNGTINIDVLIFFNFFTYINVFLLLVVIPFSLFFFKAAFVGTGTDHLRKRIIHAVSGVLFLIVIYTAIVLLIFYVGNPQKLNFYEVGFGLLCFIGWLPMAILLGIGFISMPINQFYSWYDRPTPILLEEYDTKRKIVGDRARSLRTNGEKIRDRLSKMKLLEKRKARSNFVEAVMKLKEDYIHLQTAYLFKGGNPIWPWIMLVCFILTSIFGSLWIVQILLGGILGGKNSDPLGDFLLWVQKSNVYLISFLFIILFAFYLFSAVIYGLLHLGRYFPFLLAGYKLEPMNTYNDSFIVNAFVLLLVSPALTQLLTETMPHYTDNSSVSLFYQKLASISLFKVLYTTYVFYYIMFFFMVATLILFFVWPPKQSKRLENQLEKIAAE